MVTLCLQVLVLLHIQTASIYGRSITAENKTTLKSVTSSIVLSSFLQSSNHHSMFTERLSNIRMKNGSNRYGLRSFNSHLTHFATSVWLNGITQQTTTCGCSVPATVTLSQLNNQIPTERKTETSLSKKVSPTRNKRAPKKGMRSAKVTAPESQWFTHSPTVLEYTEKSYFSNLYGSVYTTRASFTQHRNGTAIIVQAGTAYQTRLSTPFYSEAHQLLSSLNPGSRESYQTNIFGNNFLTPATQLSATHQITITSTGAVAATKLRTSPNSVPYEAHSSYFCHKTSPDSFTSSSSQTSNTRQRKKIPESRQRSPMLSIDSNTSSFAKGEYSSSWFSNSLFNHSMVQPTLKLTKFHINSRTTSKNVSRTVNFIHGPTLITTTQIPISKSYGKTTSSYLKFDLSTSWKSDYHSSIKRTDNGRLKVTRSNSNLKSDKPSTKQNQKLTTTVVNVEQHFPNHSDGGTNIPLYVITICLPLALIVGFCLALIYFKCSKQHERLQYSVTVEVTSDDPHYEMKRMYSIIDVNAGNIFKDLWSGLESDASSSSIFEIKNSSRGSLKAPT